MALRAIPACAPRHASLAAACALAAVFAAHAAAGEIAVRDEGEGGLVLTNTEPALSPPPRVDAARAPRRALLRRSQAYGPMVSAAAAAHDVPEALLRAVIEVESGFNADAVSPAGALGLMQLMPATARSLRVADARDPAANVDAGARYLRSLLARYGNDVPLALAAYNAGPLAVQRSGGIPRFAETQAYVPRVMLRYHRLQSGERE